MSQNYFSASIIKNKSFQKNESFSIDIYGMYIYKKERLLNKLKLPSFIWSARVAHTGRLKSLLPQRGL